MNRVDIHLKVIEKELALHLVVLIIKNHKQQQKGGIKGEQKKEKNKKNIDIIYFQLTQHHTLQRNLTPSILSSNAKQLEDKTSAENMGNQCCGKED